MTKVSCSIPEQYVNPLFEVFDGGDFILSSFRDVEKSLTEMRVFTERADEATIEDVKRRLKEALSIVGAGECSMSVEEIADEDWKLAYRRHFRTELVSPRILVQPEWEEVIYSIATLKLPL